MRHSHLAPQTHHATRWLAQLPLRRTVPRLETRVLTKKILLSLTIVLTSLLPLSASAGALSGPYHFLQIPDNRVSSGAPIGFAYKSSPMPKSGHLFLQLQEGTAHVWRNIVELQQVSGHFRTKGLPMGKYLYRIAVMKSSGAETVMAASPAVTLYSYSNVPLVQICNNSSFQVPFALICIGNTVRRSELGSTLQFFSYVAIGNSDTVYPAFSTQLLAPTSTCRSISLRFAEEYDASGQTGPSNPYATYVTFSQGSANPVKASAAPDKVGILSAQIVPNGSWSLSVSGAQSHSPFEDVLLNGTFSCYSPSGS